MRDGKIREKKVFEIEYEYPWSVSADWLLRLFNSPKVKSIKEIKSKQMSIDGIKDITEKFCTICANQDDVAFAIHKEQLKRLEGDNV